MHLGRRVEPGKRRGWRELGGELGCGLGGRRGGARGGGGQARTGVNQA